MVGACIAVLPLKKNVCVVLHRVIIIIVQSIRKPIKTPIHLYHYHLKRLRAG